MSEFPYQAASMKAAALQPTGPTAGGPSVFDLSPQSRQTAFWAGAVLAAANALYLIGFVIYIAAGFAGLPPAGTRLLASLSVFFGAPSLVILFGALGSKADLQARLAVGFATGFALLSIANRIPQLFILSGPGNLSSYDLYVPGSLAQLVEIAAFGPFQGLALLLGSGLFPAGGLSGWTRRLFALAGLFTLTGGTVFILMEKTVAFLGIPPVVGLLICLPAWVVLYPTAAAAAAWQFRADAGVQVRLPRTNRF